MKILWSALSLVVVAVLALVLWNMASSTDRVEVVGEGVSVDTAPAPEQSPSTIPRTPEPESPSSSGTAVPPAPPASVPPAPLPPAQVPLPVQPAPLGDDRDEELDDDRDDAFDDD